MCLPAMQVRRVWILLFISSYLKNRQLATIPFKLLDKMMLYFARSNFMMYRFASIT